MILDKNGIMIAL